MRLTKSPCSRHFKRRSRWCEKRRFAPPVGGQGATGPLRGSGGSAPKSKGTEITPPKAKEQISPQKRKRENKSGFFDGIERGVGIEGSVGSEGNVFVGEECGEIGGSEGINPCGVGGEESFGPIFGGDAHFCDGFEHIEGDGGEDIHWELGDGVWETQAEGVKGHALEIEGVVMEVILLVVAAFAVADDGVVDPAEVTAKLV